MDFPEPVYLKRPILRSDCRALVNIATLKGDVDVILDEVLWLLDIAKCSSILYEHEIDGVAHPVAWCMWVKNSLYRCLTIGSMFCHPEYDGSRFYRLMLDHVKSTVSPMFPRVLLEGTLATDQEQIDAVMASGFMNTRSISTGVDDKVFLEFCYGDAV